MFAGAQTIREGDMSSCISEAVSGDRNAMEDDVEGYYGSEQYEDAPLVELDGPHVVGLSRSLLMHHR